MKIGSGMEMGGASTVQAGAGMKMETDATIKSIQQQIALKQQELQSLSKEEGDVEEKMKKQQEIRQEIFSLNQQLRQYQMEQRQKESQGSKNQMDEMLAKRETPEEAPGQIVTISQEGMTAMISADSAVKQAKDQGHTITEMKGNASVIKGEIANDQKRKVPTAQKEAALAELEDSINKAVSFQAKTLGDAKKAMEEASVSEEAVQGSQAEEKAVPEEDETVQEEESLMENAKEQEAAEEEESAGIVNQPLYHPINLLL